MMIITAKTAQQIAYAHREVEVAEELLNKIIEAVERQDTPDFRDAFGRRSGGLQLGVPSGNNGQRLFDVPWSMCRPIIETHIAQQRANLTVLSEKALVEARPSSPVQGD